MAAMMAPVTSNGRSGEGARGALVSSIALLVLLTFFGGRNTDASSSGRELGGGGNGGEVHPHYALIFPIIAILVGVILYYIIARLLHHAFPYTAAMFVFGTIMGVVLDKLPENQVSESFNMWSRIDGHVLIMVFLPGLLFRDAYCQDIHLFRKAFGQCTIMAFPEVLAGTALTACVLTYVLPYFAEGIALGLESEAFIASMILGSILSATDPVAVSALLNSVGAPPRLKTHIAGESLLNDGAAVVFFNIFYNMDLYTFTNGQFGRTFTWGSGIAYFIKLSLGSAALGMAFGFVLVGCMWALRRRYDNEENLTQVMTTIGFAYLSFYVSESMLGMSGIICVVFCGIVAKSFASTMINDQVAMQKFWDLLEHILNTVLFALGGLIWGTVIIGDRAGDDSYGSTITGKDWGYLFALYIFLLIIRSALVLGFYPIIGRIGLRSNWQEAVFMSWGGLRGAVGIALGILVENAWLNVSAEDMGSIEGMIPEYEILFHRRVADLWFFFAGGIAFLTLVINGTTAGPLLKKLGLAAPTEIRKEIVKRYRRSMRLHSVEHMLELLTDDQFSDVDFAVVRTHISEMMDVTYDDLMAALRHVREQQPAHLYNEPNIATLEPFFLADQFNEMKELAHASALERLRSLANARQIVAAGTSFHGETGHVSEDEMIEMRKVFIALLRRAYDKLLDKGFIDARSGGLLVFKLTSSLERAGDKVARGEPLNDWETCQASHKLPVEAVAERGRSMRLALHNKETQKSDLPEYERASAVVQRVIACIAAHKLAQDAFKEEFAADGALSPVERLILDESAVQIRLAEDVVQSMNPADVCSIKAHLLCNILLNQMVHDVYRYLEKALLLPTEAEDIIHDLTHQLNVLAECDGTCDGMCNGMCATETNDDEIKCSSEENVEKATGGKASAEEEV